MEQVNAGPKVGLVMALLTVKISNMVRTSPAMIMMAATAKAVVVVVAVVTAMIASLILLLMDLNVVIQHGMNWA